MRIAILSDPVDSQLAGVHTFTKEMIKSLLRTDKRNSYYLFRRRKVPAFYGAKSIAVPKLEWTILFPLLRLFYFFGRLAKRYKIDVVIEPAFFGPFFLPKGVKRVTVIHDLTPLKFPRHHRWFYHVIFNLFVKRILKNADLIITNSENSRQDIVRYFPFTEGKIEKIYLGNDVNFSPVTNDKVLEEYNITKPYFLLVSTIEPRKNLQLLLDAYHRFRLETNHKVDLVIVGKKGWKSGKMYKKLAKHPFKKDIIMPGYVPEENLPALYTGSLAFIYPSIYEGFGLPVLEAMACGAPCIVSNSSSLPEVTGKAALLFNPFDVNELSDQMQLLVARPDLRQELSSKAIEQANVFSWDNFANELLQILYKHKIIV